MTGIVVYTFALLLNVGILKASNDNLYIELQREDLYRQRRDAPNEETQLNVLVKEFPPYIMCENITHETENTEKCQRYIGIVPDILYQMSKKASLTINYISNTDLEDSSWDGMLNALSTEESDQYDMVAGPIHITADRLSQVDFLHPFAHAKISAIIQKPHVRTKIEGGDSHWDYQFNIGEPFAPETWVTATAMLIVVWLLMTCMNKFNPYEHGWRYENDLGSEDEYKLFNLSGSLWYVLSIMQLQGYDRRPGSYAVRILSCFWMSFCLITIISYIGSASNHMFWADSVRSVDPMESPVTNLRDLIAHKDGYNYGTVRNGPAYNYIKANPMNWAKEMSKYFDGEGTKHLVDTEEEGYNMAKTSRYAFFVEDKVAKFELSKEPCDLVETGIQFGMLSYGFAVKHGSQYKDILNQVILEIIESDYITVQEQSWFAADAFCEVTNEMEKHVQDFRQWRIKEPGRVTFHEFWSVLVLIVVGTSFSIIVAGIEIFWYKYRGRYRSAYYSGSNWSTPS